MTTDYPWPGDPVGGIFHRTAARALVRAGVRVVVVSPTPVAPWPLPIIRERWRRYAQAPRRQLDEGVEVIRPSYPVLPGDPGWARSDSLMAQLTRRILAAHPETDLVHAHYPAPMGMAAWRVARATGLPYVITHHGSDEAWRRSHKRQLPVYRLALQEAARVLAVSQSLVEELRDAAGVDADVLPIGIGLERFIAGRMSRERARSDLGIAPDRVVALFVAMLLPSKGVRPFVDAIVGLGKPFLGILVGDGPEFGYRMSDAAAQGLVDFRGVQPNELIPAYLAAADMLVLPSDTEGLPTVLVEAGAAGVPVIASAVGGVPDLLAGDRGLVLRDNSASAIAEAVQAVKGDYETARVRAERLRSFVNEEYDADANARRLCDVYREVLRG